MKYLISTGIVLTLLTAVIFFGFTKNVNAGSTITTGSGSVTAIEGGYESANTNTYQSGSSNNTTTTNTSHSNMKSSPPSSSAPMVNSTSNCAFALSGGVQTFSVGISGGKSYVDKTCQLIALSNALSNRGMKIASIQVLCSDDRIFKSMILSATPCPVLDLKGKAQIGDEALKLLEEVYNFEQPTYEKWVELRKKQIELKKETILPIKKPIKNVELHTK